MWNPGPCEPRATLSTPHLPHHSRYRGRLPDTDIPVILACILHTYFPGVTLTSTGSYTHPAHQRHPATARPGAPPGALLPRLTHPEQLIK